ncbi:MAG TPA: 16S rRNA (adenine(1518)-N(6)/adenine(1519)-N(6))-dimethyltransferase RsmA [Actinomycetota bacterium]|nr:16S rRNA (adenine(1518)-N(6)/adenine(1519)-N(6))-dimethyltransferase RsmA [Actinomycetota bacterium]
MDRTFGAGELRALATRHGIRPKRSLGQHFLVDPNLARAIAADVAVGPGDRVVEIGAGLGSLTRALAETGADVLAIEVDAALLPPLRESLGGLGRLRVLHADATDRAWHRELEGEGWVLAANLPYNVGTDLVLEVLEDVAAVRRLVVMVQREVGDRLLAGPGDAGYGPASLRVALRATGAVIRRVPPEVFWPRPTVESVVVRLERRARSPVAVDEARLREVVDAGFAERRKTMRNALRRLGADDADAVLGAAGVEPAARAESLALEDFARIAAELARSLPARAPSSGQAP